MAIWIWIIVAWVLSYLALGKNKVSFEHLIWIILPVDFYGIVVANAVIKPYMLFCGLLLIRLVMRRREQYVLSGWVYNSLLISIAVLLINLVNNQTAAAPKAALLLLIVWGCIVLYLLNCGKSTATDIPNVMVAAGIGYGIVYIVGFILMSAGIDAPGVASPERLDEGFFMATYNVHEGLFIFTYRLRGFTIDPNAMIATFAFCSVACILRITKGVGTLREWIGLVVSAVCVLLSGSRMGLICFLILLVITFVIGYRLASTKVRNIIKLSLPLLTGVLVIVLLATDVIQNSIADIISSYDNRSGLNDEYGRFTIWKDAISVLFERNPLLGVGMGQDKYYIAIGKNCHNTWLSMIIDNGLIVGGMMILHFIYALIVGFRKAMNNKLASKQELLWTLAIGTLIVMVSLVSVTNVTFSYLWFGASLLTLAGGNSFDEYYTSNS